MATKTINVDMLAKMFLAGAQNIEARKEYGWEFLFLGANISGSGWRYRYEHVYDDHVSGKRSNSTGSSGYEDPG